MRVVAWQFAIKTEGGDACLARPRSAMPAPHAAERSFGTLATHNYIERPWGPGGVSPG